MYQVIKMTALSLIIVCVSGCAVGSRPSMHEASATGRAAASAGEGQLSGAWRGSLTDPGGGRHPVTLNLKVEGAQVSGTLAGAPPDGSEQPLSNGKLAGDRITFQIKTRSPTGEPFVLSFEGRVRGNRIQGSHGPEGEGFPWEATKQE